MKRIILLAICLPFLTGATYYVKWDAAGTGDGSSWTNAYTTVSACIADHTGNGDICEISGGTTGHAYVEVVDFRSGAAATIRGSYATGHSGAVTIGGAGLGEAALLINLGKTVENVTLTSTDAEQYALKIYGNGTFNDVIISGSTRAIVGGWGSSFTATFTRCTIKSSFDAAITVSGYPSNVYVFNYCLFYNNAAHIQMHSATATFNNCVFDANWGNYAVLKANNSEATINVVNSIFTGNISKIGNSHVIDNPDGGTVNVSNSILQLHPTNPASYGYSNITDGGGNTYNSPKITSHYRGQGMVSLGVDEDYGNHDADATCDLIVGYANARGMKVYCALETLTDYTAGDWATLAGYVAQGHKVYNHTFQHINGETALTDDGSGGVVKITGPATATVVVSTNRVDANDSSTWTGTLVCKEGTTTKATFNIALGQADDLAGSLISHIGSCGAGWSAALVNTGQGGGSHNILMKDGTYDVTGTGWGIPLDINKFMHYDYVEAKKYIEDNIGGGYQADVIVYPGGVVTAAMVTWLNTQSNFDGLSLTKYLGGRTAATTAGSFTLTGTSHVSAPGNVAGSQVYWLSSPHVSEAIGTSNIKRNVDGMLDWIGAIGGTLSFYTHTTTEYSAANLQTFMNALIDNPSVRIVTPSAMVAEIRTYTDADETGLRWVKTETDSSNYMLLGGSPAINAGKDVSLTSDYIGTEVPKQGTPDIGAYEYFTKGGLFQTFNKTNKFAPHRRLH